VCFLKRNAAFAPISFDVLKMITLQIELEMNFLDKNVNELEFQLCNVDGTNQGVYRYMLGIWLESLKIRLWLKLGM
jgi:hypothetical protein